MKLQNILSDIRLRNIHLNVREKCNFCENCGNHYYDHRQSDLLCWNGLYQTYFERNFASLRLKQYRDNDYCFKPEIKQI